jgi:hypothetical protein
MVEDYCEQLYPLNMDLSEYTWMIVVSAIIVAAWFAGSALGRFSDRFERENLERQRPLDGD